jgi:hypothetical protein
MKDKSMRKEKPTSPPPPPPIVRNDYPRHNLDAFDEEEWVKWEQIFSEMHYHKVVFLSVCRRLKEDPDVSYANFMSVNKKNIARLLKTIESDLDE